MNRTTSSPQSALVTRIAIRVRPSSEKASGDQVGIERFVAIAQRKVDRALAGQDLLGLGAKRGLVVRHPRGNVVQLGKAEKSGRGQEEDEDDDLDRSPFAPAACRS